jgi:hypothetical protein
VIFWLLIARISFSIAIELLACDPKHALADLVS